MNEELVLRMNLLGGMNDYILNVIGDDNETDRWFTHGLPDGCDEDELKEICEHDRLFGEVLAYGARIIDRHTCKLANNN